MGGEISVESEPQRGSVFSFTVVFRDTCQPAHKSEVKMVGLGIDQVAEETTSQVICSPLNILVAEDNLVNQKLVVKLLQKQGHTVELAANGENVLELVEIETWPEMVFNGVETNHQRQRRPCSMKGSIRRRIKISKKEIRRRALAVAEQISSESNSRYELIQMLVPLGLAAVGEQLQREVEKLTGKSYERDEGVLRRWGSNPGSVYLGGQKLGIEVPRVRDISQRCEVALESYKALQAPKNIDERVYRSLVNGLSSRNYSEVAETVPETFGISKSAVSVRFKKATAARLAELMERDLGTEDIISIFIDGKHLAETDMILALGITMKGEKIPLGFIEASAENSMVCKEFLLKLIARGLSVEREILFIIDGAKGLHKGIKDVFGTKAIIQRCQWHKRENVVSYLSKEQAAIFRKKLQVAYEQPTHDKAKAKLKLVQKELLLLNQSAAASLDEGLEETLTLHRLGLMEQLGCSFKTTNCIESLNRQVAIRTDRVCYWKNSEQRQRWIAMALLEIEPSLNKVKGSAALPLLRSRMSESLNSAVKFKLAA
jgi:transposase-like protein